MRGINKFLVDAEASDKKTLAAKGIGLGFKRLGLQVPCWDGDACTMYKGP